MLGHDVIFFSQKYVWLAFLCNSYGFMFFKVIYSPTSLWSHPIWHVKVALLPEAKISSHGWTSYMLTKNNSIGNFIDKILVLFLTIYQMQLLCIYKKVDLDTCVNGMFNLWIKVFIDHKHLFYSTKHMLSIIASKTSCKDKIPLLRLILCYRSTQSIIYLHVVILVCLAR